MAYARDIPQVKPENMRQFMANTINDLLTSLNYNDSVEHHSVELYRTHNGAWLITVYQGDNHYEFKLRMTQL